MASVNNKSTNPNGVVLYEDPTRVVIATGLSRASDNAKTGDMVQVWILHRHVSPMAAIRTGRDNVICGNCPHRGVRRMVGATYKVSGRRCYVQVDKAPTGIWRAYRNNRYRRVDASEYPALFGGRMVRFGAYGDPAYIPVSILQAIAAAARDWTGYTHQWRNAPEYRAYLMASVDSDADVVDAVAAGWRYFRVRSTADLALAANEIRCPASAEGGKKTTCANCRLCNGAKYGENDRRKSITILDHSAIRNSQPLVQIAL